METEKVRDLVDALPEEDGGFKPSRSELKRARKALKPEDFRKFREEEDFKSRDPLGFLKEKLADVEKQVERTDNPRIKGQLRVLLDQLPETIRTMEARLKKIEDETNEVNQENEVRGRALRRLALKKGPLLSGRAWQRMKKISRWLLKPFKWGVGLLVGILKEIARFYLDCTDGIAIMAGLLLFVWIIVFNSTFGLGVNGLFFFVAVIILLLIFAINFTEEGGARIIPATFFLLIFFFLGGTMTFWRCVTPLLSNGNYWIGAIKNGSQIVEVINSRNWFMRPPKFWRGETIEWQGIEYSYTSGFHEEWERTIGTVFGKNVVLHISVNPKLRPENSRKIFEGGKKFIDYQKDIRMQVEALLPPASENRLEEGETGTTIGLLIPKIRGVSNDLFWLNDVSVRFEIK